MNRKNKRWTRSEEMDLLRSRENDMGWVEMSHIFGRSQQALYAKYHALKTEQAEIAKITSANPTEPKKVPEKTPEDRLHILVLIIGVITIINSAILLSQ